MISHISHRLTFFLFIILMSIGLIASTNINNPTSINLPPGFAIQTITDELVLPVDMAFLPNNDILVAEKGWGEGANGISHVRLVRNGVTLDQRVLELSTNVFWDSGLNAIEISPNFAQDNFFYVKYATGENVSGYEGQSTMRVSRFTYNPQTRTADPNSELVLLELDNWAKWHHGNSLMFDTHGNLFISVGELESDDAPSDLSRLEGKILRIRPEAGGYSIPIDNPYRDNPDARPEIYASGFRNPYRIAQRADGVRVVGDVGAATWEEINYLQPGGNYGWPHREGPCPLGQTSPCAPDDSLNGPAIWYEHIEADGNPKGGSVTGLAYYEGTEFPDIYQGDLFHADYHFGFIRATDPYGWHVKEFATNVGAVVALEYHNEKLYYLDVRGKLQVIYYTGSANDVPTASIEADQIQGAPPFAVEFTGTANDPDDDVFSYEWDFGDGNTIVSSSEVVSHTYQQSGEFTAQLTVKDIRGGTSQTVDQTIIVYGGEFPEITLTNLTASRTNYHGGDEVQFRADRSSIADLDPDIPYTWRIDLHHNIHTHPLISQTNVLQDVVTIPQDNHEGEWNLWYEFILTMHTADGLDITVRKEVYPQVTSIAFRTVPEGSPIMTINEVEGAPPIDIESIVGINNHISVAETMIIDRDVYQFTQWTWPSGVSFSPDLISAAPNSANTTYSARYQYARPADVVFLSVIDN